MRETSATLIPDNPHRWGEFDTAAEYLAEAPLALTERIHPAGLAGGGGAGFPSGNTGAGGYGKVDTLIINAAECEPYITADDRLMREHAAEIITGCEILRHILSPQRTLIGIEDNKPEAIAALKLALQGHDDIKLRVIPTKYPSGGAKQLTKILTGMEVPFGKHSASIGVLMQNVGTVYAIKRAIIDGEPLIERVVTLTGELMKKPGNVWARLGTPVKHLLQAGEFEAQNRSPMVIMGGPLMGFTLAYLNVPIVKISNCILAPSKSEFDEASEEQACIRCSQCADACPAGLLPQQLYWFSRGQEHEKARQHHLFDCIECGACAYVCPSSIPLVQYYRQEKAEIKAADQEAARAAQAKERFEARQARLEREKAARELRHKQAAVKVTETDQSAVQAAVARVKQRQEQQTVSAQFIRLTTIRKITAFAQLVRRVKPWLANVSRKMFLNLKPKPIRVRQPLPPRSLALRPKKPRRRIPLKVLRRPMRISLFLLTLLKIHAKPPSRPLSRAPKRKKRMSLLLWSKQKLPLRPIRARPLWPRLLRVLKQKKRLKL